MARVLILSASIGEGHDLPARLLAGALRERGAEVWVEDGLAAMGGFIKGLTMRGSHGRRFELSYWLAVTFGPTRRLQAFLCWAVGRHGLAALVRERQPDVVVSTYPGVNEPLARERLGVPLVSAITDLAALRFWAHPAFALHLITQAESVAEVRAIAGPATRIAHVRGLLRPEFDEPVDRALARRELGLPADGAVAVVSGGGWAVGDLEGAARACARAGAQTVALCGSDAALRARLGSLDGVEAWGFTDRMGDLLGAADVLVHSTAGLTVLEAQVRGARVVSYGWGAGHIRVNNHAYTSLDMAEVARTPAQLAAALDRALARPRRPDRSHERLPQAADEVLRLVRPATPPPAPTRDRAGR